MGKIRILVVDDEEDLCEILQFNLENEGYVIDVAYSAETALKLLTPDHSLILLDVMMEKMSGFKMAEKVRKEYNLSTPIIFLTARDTENDMLTGFSLGGDDYISKPFSIKEVIARVKAVLKRSGKITPMDEQDVVELDGLVLDNLNKTVSYKGCELLLTRKEFDILRFLISKPNRIFSREDILSNVWGKQEFVLERTVDVHITRLRKKLGEFGKKIVNRSGYGYCIEL